MTENKPVAMVAVDESAQISRNTLMWINTCPELPTDVDVVRYEYLPAAAPSMALSSIQGAYIIQKYITGGYQAEYQYKLIYRIKPGDSIDKRLKADETLTRIGAWVSTRKPILGDGINVTKVEATSNAALFAAYDDGDEDHQILMKLTYEVNV